MYPLMNGGSGCLSTARAIALNTVSNLSLCSISSSSSPLLDTALVGAARVTKTSRSAPMGATYGEGGWGGAGGASGEAGTGDGKTSVPTSSVPTS